MNDLIRVENLSKTYRTDEVETKAVQGVSFEIKQGEFVSIMGASGSGKSTLMQMLGFLDRPTEGNYFFKNKNTVEFSDDEISTLRNEEIGFVFQSFNLLVRTSVYENVELPLLYSRLKKQRKDKQRIEKALAAVGLSHRINYSSNQLSGGEKQRVAIARALVNDPELIFADEPTGNLDSKSGIQVMKILQNLNRQGKTVVLVTHETYTAEHAKRILLMKDGKIISDKQVENIKDAEWDTDLK